MYLSLLHVNVGNRPGRQWLGNLYHVHQRLWMAFPDERRRQEDPFFLDTWNGPPLGEPKPKRRDAGFLFRIERDGRPRILVQSAQRPAWEWAFQNASYLLAKEPQIREIDPTACLHQTYRFRLLANVIRSKSVPDPGRRTRTTRSGLTIVRRRRTEVVVLPEPIPDPLPVDPTERQCVFRARWDPWRKWLDEIAAGRGFRVIDDDDFPLRMEAVHTSVRNRGSTKEPLSIDRRYNGGLFEGQLVCTNPHILRDSIIDGVGHAKAFGFGLLSLVPV